MKANTATTTNMSRVLLQVQISQKTLEEKLNDEWARLRYEGKQSAS
jgi:cell division protein FtsL